MKKPTLKELIVSAEKAGTTKDNEITNPSELAKKIKQNLKSKGKPW
ncbi:hypothetical protein [uncultured Enterococcus sp.]|nr:hypothetical protein [uncultured Enterococcus sp.]